MDQRIFEHKLHKAKTMAKIENPDYWAGYMRGLRRRYHGDTFCADEEHRIYLGFKDDPDPKRRAMGKGYRDAYIPEENGKCL